MVSERYSKDEVVLCYHGDIMYEAKILDVRKTQDKKDFEYRVHYKGWKNTWDDWVTPDRLRKNTDDNRELAGTLRREAEALMRSRAKVYVKKRDAAAARGSEDRQSTGKGTKRHKENEIEKEEQFQERPSVRIIINDTLKCLLVDDWEHVTKDMKIVALPAKVPVNEILKRYIQEELPNRKNAAEVDVLEEVIAGLHEYFEKAITRILLYPHEREQYRWYRSKIEKGDPLFKDSTWSDIYGAEHIARLIAVMPELLAQTNMGVQSINRAREELSKFSLWLSKHAEDLFAAKRNRVDNLHMERIPGAHSGTATSQLLSQAKGGLDEVKGENKEEGEEEDDEEGEGQDESQDGDEDEEGNDEGNSE